VARSTHLHGWTRDDAALILSNAVGVAKSAIDVLTVDRTGLVRTGHIDNVINETARLIAGRNELFVTRAVDNVENVFAMDLGTGRLRSISTNVRLDDTFGSVEPYGPNFVIGGLHRKTVDINILDARGTAKAGRTGR